MTADDSACEVGRGGSREYPVERMCPLSHAAAEAEGGEDGNDVGEGEGRTTVEPTQNAVGETTHSRERARQRRRWARWMGSFGWRGQPSATRRGGRKGGKRS